MNWINKCHFGDCRPILRAMIAAGVKVQCIVTSPPYWGLRSYLPDGHALKHLEMGQETTLREFIDKQVEVFTLCRDLLADDGTLWLNMGDSYCGGGRGSYDTTSDNKGNTASKGLGRPMTKSRRRDDAMIPRSDVRIDGLKAKDLVGQPWRLAFALQDAGWYLRQDIIWHKPNPMPESVRDRCTKAHEYMFLLTKSGHYYYDANAIKEPATYGPTPSGVGFGHGTDADMRERARIHVPGNINPARGQIAYEAGGEHHRTKAGLQRYAAKVRESVKRIGFDGKTNDLVGREAFRAITELRNKRSVWTIATTPYAGAHFATFPEKLVEPCILAGSRSGDIVFDPFFGSGTVGQVASRLGRHFIGCELNDANDPLQSDRLRQPGFVFE